jgi:hypothetical protein
MGHFAVITHMRYCLWSPRPMRLRRSLGTTGAGGSAIEFGWVEVSRRDRALAGHGVGRRRVDSSRTAGMEGTPDLNNVSPIPPCTFSSLDMVRMGHLHSLVPPRLMPYRRCHSLDLKLTLPCRHGHRYTTHVAASWYSFVRMHCATRRLFSLWHWVVAQQVSGLLPSFANCVRSLATTSACYIVGA